MYFQFRLHCNFAVFSQYTNEDTRHTASSPSQCLLHELHCFISSFLHRYLLFGVHGNFRKSLHISQWENWFFRLFLPWNSSNGHKLRLLPSRQKIFPFASIHSFDRPLSFFFGYSICDGKFCCWELKSNPIQNRGCKKEHSKMKWNDLEKWRWWTHPRSVGRK